MAVPPVAVGAQAGRCDAAGYRVDARTDRGVASLLPVASRYARGATTPKGHPVTDDFKTTMAALATGDPAARDRLFAESLPALMAFLRARVGAALGGRESVRDMAQSVCREVLRDLPKLQFAREEQFRAYLFLQATRKVLDRNRYHKQEKRDAARVKPLPDDGEEAEALGALVPLTPSRVAGAREELTRVELALQQLPEAQRDAVLLSRIAGLSYEEIARQKGISSAAVRGLVARGLARLVGLVGPS
ncbi:MAG: sigma-70 family RNA polymerase sigma factor [Planctomycetes bacterium]|nr:sigma-70 family RNA polymerase sigma factor [Planctomycetota bacterium]